MATEAGRPAGRACRWAAIVLLAAVVTGCASVPLSTLWAMRDVGPEDLADIDPAGLRLAVRMEPDGVRVDADRSTLRLTLSPRRENAEPVVVAMGLRPSAVPTAGLVPAGESGWQVFGLDGDSVRLLEAHRPLLETVEQDFRSVAFAFAVRTLPPDEGGEVPSSFRLGVRLALADGRPPFTLVRRHRIPVTQVSEAAHSPNEADER